MRRILLVAGALGLAGCSSFGDLFTAHADVAATAAGQSLTAEQLAGMMAKAKGAQMNAETADFIAGVWVDYTVFAQAVARNDLKSDSATVAEVLWPQVAEAKGAVWYDTLAARRSKPPAGLADSAYLADTVRVFQHILFSVQATAPAEDRAKAKKQAQLTLAQLQQGANFSLLASKLSGDPASAREGGYLPPAKKGAYVTAFDSAGWRLAPGQMSGLVETPFGYHIIRRPTMDESRDRMLAYLTQDATRRLDSVYMDSLGVRYALKVSEKAPALMRSALEDKSGMRKSGKKLATYTGGSLTVQEYLRWLAALPPQFSAQVKDASDEQLTQFARALTTNQILLHQADSAGITLPPVEWTAMMATYLATVDTLKLTVGLGPDVSDSNTAVAEREKLAQVRVDDFFTRVFAQQVRLRPLPGALGQLLQDREGAQVRPAGITRAVDLAIAAQAKSGAPAAGGAGGDTTGAVRPAAGPPPVSAPPAAKP